MQIFTADILPSQQVTVEKVLLGKLKWKGSWSKHQFWVFLHDFGPTHAEDAHALISHYWCLCCFCCWTKADFRNQEAVKKKSWQKSSGCAENLHRETSTMHDNHLKLTIQLIYFCLCDKIKRLGCGGNESDNPRPFITSYRINIILFAIQTLFKITFVLESIRSPAL